MTIADLWLDAGLARRRPGRPRRRPRSGRGRRRGPGSRVESTEKHRRSIRGPAAEADPVAIRAPMTVYVAEECSAEEEADILRRYFTNLDGPVFALVNLPEVVKGALFARYSREPQEPAAPLPRRVRRRSRHQRRHDGRRHGRAAAGRGAVRPGLLRVRRRLRGPARRRAPGLRAGLEPAHEGARVGPPRQLPRAVDPVHRL